MGIIYRADKGAPLTSQEIDGNFRELESRLSILEEHPETGEGIAKVDFQKDRLTFTGSFGTDFGSFPLPKSILPLRGEWCSQTHYHEQDMVTIETGMYQCLTDHISTLWQQDQDKWKPLVLFQKSTSPSLPLFEKATLPKEDVLGKIGLLFEEENPVLIYFNGKSWQKLMNGGIQ